MTEVIKIGQKARNLDEKSISKRLQLDKDIFVRIGLAILFYLGILGLMSFIL